MLFYFVDTSVTENFTSIFSFVLSGIHKMLFLVKRTSQHFMEPTFTMLQVYNNAVSSKPAEMQFISGYFKT